MFRPNIKIRDFKRDILKRMFKMEQLPQLSNRSMMPGNHYAIIPVVYLNNDKNAPRYIRAATQDQQFCFDSKFIQPVWIERAKKFGVVIPN